MRIRINYFLIVIFIIITGIISRKFHFIPLCIGDILYAMMIYFSVRIVFIQKPRTAIAISSLTICFCVEFSQLYQTEWINDFRNTFIGHHILGQGFLWSDLIAYAFGVLISYLFEFIFKKTDS